MAGFSGVRFVRLVPQSTPTPTSTTAPPTVATEEAGLSTSDIVGIVIGSITGTLLLLLVIISAILW